MRVKFLIVLAALAAVGAIFTPSALADGGCPVCQVIPADQTVVHQTESTSLTSSHTRIRVVKKVRLKIKQYERINHVTVAINMVPKGISRRGCVDPTKLGIGFRVGDSFRNTREDGSPFWEAWEAGWMICNPHKVKIGGQWYLKGTKQNCGNEGILIPIHARRQHKVVARVETFHTIKSFISTYNRWYSRVSKHKSTTITVSTVEYSCPSGWTLEGSSCKNCPPCPPPPPPPPAKCPPGTVGTPPNCYTPTCPPGTVGTPPNCTTPPPAHYTQVTCSGFEEISGGGSFLVDCDVQDDNGAPIALSVSTSPYYTVSGINCYSQGGTPSCTGDGTFEFRVDGVNNSNNVVQASMTVTATANGVPAYYKADFNVDPSGGGF